MTYDELLAEQAELEAIPEEAMTDAQLARYNELHYEIKEAALDL